MRERGGSGESGERDFFSMKLGREMKGIPSADLLVCFPSRSHLSLMQNPLCSPARGSDSSNKLRRTHRGNHRRRKSTSAASPVVWARAKTMGLEMSEPSSPKVTCAGQIKIRPKSSKSWQSVMEEIERIHNRRKLRRRKFNWVESLGFKKDIMQFLTCLRNIRFDFRCFKAFPEADFTTEEDDEEEEEELEEGKSQVGVERNESEKTAFSKWFMVLQESGTNEIRKERNSLCTVDDAAIEPPMAPPKNALLLMRCRSAPAKSWLEEESEEEEEEEEEEEKEETEKKKKKSLKWLMEEENRERLAMEMTSDVAKETWVVKDLFSRSRSWKV